MTKRYDIEHINKVDGVISNAGIKLGLERLDTNRSTNECFLDSEMEEIKRLKK